MRAAGAAARLRCSAEFDVASGAAVDERAAGRRVDEPVAGVDAVLVALGDRVEAADAVEVADGVGVGLVGADVVGVGAAVDVGDAVDVGEAVGAAVVAAGGSVTVRVVAQSAPTLQEPPCEAAAVVSFAPSGALSATLTLKETLAREPMVPGSVSAGTTHVSVLDCASRLSPRSPSSPGLVAIPAWPSTPDRSSSTWEPWARARALTTWSV
jgi:hypothetical protein